LDSEKTAITAEKKRQGRQQRNESEETATNNATNEQGSNAGNKRGIRRRNEQDIHQMNAGNAVENRGPLTGFLITLLMCSSQALRFRS
jgi:hypothetical protein